MALFLADTSAWSRGYVNEEIGPRWVGMVERGELAMCAPVRLELLYSARGPADYATIDGQLARLPYLPLDERAVSLARRVQAALAARSRHRGPKPIDLLIAAIAEVNDATLIHYDRHFDAIARVTGQPMQWLARPGSLP